jgi:hypothetical protein
MWKSCPSVASSRTAAVITLVSLPFSGQRELRCTLLHVQQPAERVAAEAREALFLFERCAGS